MEKQNIPDFIVIDDDAFNNRICSMIIQRISPEADVQAFTEPEIGLEHISSAYMAPTVNNAILFLDINMPTMTGWEFMEHYEQIDIQVKNHIKIYIVSSYIDEVDKKRANTNKNIAGYIAKPLSSLVIQDILSKPEL